MGWSQIPWGYSYPSTDITNPFGGENQSIIDATGEKFAYMGQIWMPERGTRNISKVHFKFGSLVTKAGGSALTLSLQNVTMTTQYTPDETQDQTCAIANASATFAANTWHSCTLSSTRTVTDGEWVAIVIEFDGAGRLGADLIRFPQRTRRGEAGTADAVAGLKTGGTWAATNGTDMFPFVFEFDDGTFGNFMGTAPIHNSTADTFNSTSTPDEKGNQFTVSFPCKVDALWATTNTGSPLGDFDLCLYEGTTLLASVSVDASVLHLAAKSRAARLSSEVTLRPGVTYVVSIKPTTANNLTAEYSDVISAAYAVLLPGGDNFKRVTRTDSGSWSAASTTQRQKNGLVISAVLDGHNVSGIQPIEQGVSR